MARARAALVVEGPLDAVEALWYDVARWPAFVDGCARVVALEGDWPHAGTVLTWESQPRGRGRVVERVVAYEPGAGQACAVRDAQLGGTQSVAFAERDGRVQVTLELDYRLAGGRLARLVRMPLDALFVRGALSASLQRTLVRFRDELLR